MLKNQYPAAADRPGARMKEADMAKDPVCGMQVSEQQAKATAEHKGQQFYFCSADCKTKFAENPERYGRQTA
jgi:YHS domain-containing protein